MTDGRIGRRRSYVIRRKLWMDQAAAVKIENDQRRNLVAVDTGDHDVAHQWRAGRDKPRAQRADADPGAAGELKILGDAAVEIEPGAEIAGVCRLQRIAKLVKTFLVQVGSGQFALPPIARRDIRPLGADLDLAINRNKFGVVAGDG